MRARSAKLSPGPSRWALRETRADKRAADLLVSFSWMTTKETRALLSLLSRGIKLAKTEGIIVLDIFQDIGEQRRVMQRSIFSVMEARKLVVLLRATIKAVVRSSR